MPDFSTGFTGNAAARARPYGQWLAAATLVLLAALFGWLLIDVIIRGFGSLSWEFISSAPTDAGRSGGIWPVIVASLATLAVCMAAVLPIGLGSAALLSGVFGAPRSSLGQRAVNGCRQSLDILAGVPSIVFGLFGNAFFCLYLGMGFSILAGGLTLACMVLPYFIRTAEHALRSAATTHLAGSLALGLRHSTMLRRILLPAALPGLFAGFVLALTRALAETAALLFTSGYVSRMPESLLDSGRVLSVHVYDLAMNVTGGEAQAYSTALVLIITLAVINVLVALLGHYWQQKLNGAPQ